MFHKIKEFYETQNVRFGLMIIGDTMSGKSTVYKSLERALNWLNEKQNDPKSEEKFRFKYDRVVSKALNPKSISMKELYGEVDVNTQEWSDGLASI